MRDAGISNFLRNNRSYTSNKANLHRSANLPAVQHIFYKFSSR